MSTTTDPRLASGKLSREDREDLRAIVERRGEPTISYETLLEAPGIKRPARPAIKTRARKEDSHKR